MHLDGVTFEIYYPASPYHPCTPIFARFSGVLNPDGRLHAKLDSMGSIPGTSASPGIPVRGFFAIDPKGGSRSFTGFLSNDRVDGEAQWAPGPIR
jgi:hypothetical protein